MENKTKTGNIGSNGSPDCQVVRDLLPLYVEGDCSEGSRQLVEAHIQTCTPCRRELAAMGKALVVPEPQAAEKVLKPKKALRRYTMGLCLIFCLLFVVSVPTAALCYSREVTSRQAAKAAEPLERAEQVMNAWLLGDYEGAAALMEPSELYTDLCSGSAEKTLWACPEPSGFTAYSVGEETYWVAEDLSLDTGTHNGCLVSLDSSCQEAREIAQRIQTAAESGDELAFLYEILSLNLEEAPEAFALPSETLAALAGRYGADFVTALCSGGTPFSVQDETLSGYQVAYEDVSVGEALSPRLLEAVPEAQEIEPLFWYAAISRVLPDELYQLYSGSYQDIERWYQSYADYNSALGEEQFIETWRQRFVSYFSALESEGIVLTACEKYEEIIVPAARVSEDGTQESFTRLSFFVTFSDNRKGLLYLALESDGSCYWCGAEGSLPTALGGSSESSATEFFAEMDAAAEKGGLWG